jgi:hypothetical protein
MAGGDRRPPQPDVTRRVDPLSPPAWWETESQRRLRQFRTERAYMRVDAGLFDGPAGDILFGLRLDAPGDTVEGGESLGSVAEIAPLVRNMIERQRERYESLMKQPRPGSHSDEILAHHLVIEFPAETWEQDRRTEHRLFLPGVSKAMGLSLIGPSLDRLHSRSVLLAQRLGINQAECLVWGLTDFAFTIPWLATTVRSGPWGESSSVTIQVNSTNATAPEVAKAYTLARAHRSTRPWPALVVAFLEQVMSDKTWDEKFRAFASAYPDQKYKSMQTFRQAYYDQKKKEGKRRRREP